MSGDSFEDERARVIEDIFKICEEGVTMEKLSPLLKRYACVAQVGNHFSVEEGEPLVSSQEGRVKVIVVVEIAFKKPVPHHN